MLSKILRMFPVSGNMITQTVADRNYVGKLMSLHLRIAVEDFQTLLTITDNVSLVH